MILSCCEGSSEKHEFTSYTIALLKCLIKVFYLKNTTTELQSQLVYASNLVFQTCDIKTEGRKRFLTLKNVQLDQAGEVSYQALNAVTSAMLTVKGTDLSQIKLPLFSVVCCKLLHLFVLENGGTIEQVR